MVYKMFPREFKQVIAYSTSILLALLVFMGIAVVYAWAEPSQSPPSGNVPAPVNVGDTTQYKTGAFGVGGVFHGYSTGIFDGSVTFMPTSQPASPVDGMLYYDSSLKKFRCREDGAWKDCVGLTADQCQNYYADADRDGIYASAPVTICGAPPAGYSTTPGTDCNDFNAAVWQNRNLYADADGDTYYSSVISKVECIGATAPAGYSLTAGNDCYDSGANAGLAHPGQTGYFGSPRGDGSFDYDCDLSTTYYYTIFRTFDWPDAGYCRVEKYCGATGYCHPAEGFARGSACGSEYEWRSCDDFAGGCCTGLCK